MNRNALEKFKPAVMPRKDSSSFLAGAVYNPEKFVTKKPIGADGVFRKPVVGMKPLMTK